MDKQIAQNILAFLERINLAPREIQAFLEVQKALNDIIKAEE